MSGWFAELIGDEKGRADEQAVISLLAAAVFLGLEVFSVTLRGQPFDPLSFGAGFGTLLGAASAGFGLRAHLTPGSGDSSTMASQP